MGTDERRWRRPLRDVTIAALLLAYAIGAWWMLWTRSEEVGRNLGLAYFVQATFTNAALAFFFGRTLVAGREPLCTRLARMIRGQLEPRVEAYTRKVTIAWTVFFVVMLVASIGLYVLAPLSVWSGFANVLMLPLVALMFVVEYAIRIRRFPDLPHKPIVESLRAYWNSPRASTTRPR